MTERVRISVWAWGDALDDLENVCLPSLAQPGNIPWLLANGYRVTLDFCTMNSSRERVAALGSAAHARLAAPALPGTIDATITSITDGLNNDDAKCLFLKRVMAQSVDEGSKVVFAFADRFFGDGSIRNVVTYAKKPGVVVGGLDLTVDRNGFRELLAGHVAVTAGQPVSNARLVDMSLRSLSERVRSAPGMSIKPVDDTLDVLTTADLKPMLFYFEPDDVVFFERFQCHYSLFNAVWPTMLSAQNRWRVMASSDLFCVAEMDHGRPRSSAGPNETHLLGRIHETFAIGLRREKL